MKPRKVTSFVLMKNVTILILGICFAFKSFGQTKSTNHYYGGKSFQSWSEAASKARETYKAAGLTDPIGVNNLDLSRVRSSSKQSEIPKPYKAPGSDLFNTKTARAFSGSKLNTQRFYDSECFDELGYSAFRNYESQLLRYEECESKKLRKRILFISLTLLMIILIGAYIANAFMGLSNLLGKNIISLVEAIKARLEKVKINARKKKCQFCQSRVNYEAIVCKFCQRDLVDL